MTLKIKIARKKQNENPVGCTGEGKILKSNTREGSREGKTGTVFQLSLAPTRILQTSSPQLPAEETNLPCSIGLRFVSSVHPIVRVYD